LKVGSALIETDREHVRLLKGLAHPLRLELLAMMSYREISPKDFARHRGEPVSNLSYHFRLLEELGCIELARTRPVRGSVEHIYRRIKRVVFSDRDWLIMPDEARQIVASTILRDLVGRMTQAIEAGTFTARQDVHITWRPVTLDEQGWTEVMEILVDTFEAVSKAEVEAIERMRESGEDGLEATVALAGFESPRSSPSPQIDQAGTREGADPQ
jgi:DNA-binding transcriptional ArsR family regulator